MRKLLNTLFVTQPNVYLSLDGDNIILNKEDEKLGRIPLHNLESVVSFGYTGASPALMGYCADHNISIVFLTMNGRFLARVSGISSGNVHLRKQQYRLSDNLDESCLIAKNFIVGKVFNQKWMLERAKRNYPLRVDINQIDDISSRLTSQIKEIRKCKELDRLRGLEGQAATYYNQVFNEMILNQKEDFYFHARSRRPPRDKINAILSFAYTLLANDTAAALETVGLDAYVGFMHRDRPGRPSLALDLMEELRGIVADRFVISLINRNEIVSEDFIEKENGSVILKEEPRKRFLQKWQQKKQETIKHPFLGETISWGLVPYSQALLLARYIRGDLDQYPPFMWK